MKPISIQKLADLVAAQELILPETLADAQLSRVEFDSRRVEPGTLFVPLVGGATDGHSYAKQAAAQGATAILWSHPLDEFPSEIDTCAVIRVPDTLLAMQQLARAYRLAINPKVVAITGSNGKTTTKDMTAAVLAEHYQVHKTAGNYNNEIGLPHTILSMSETTEVLVVELGMSNFGEIETLSQIALPDIAAVTIIGESHLEYLGSRAGIAQAKTEILDGLQSGGLFIYPGGETLIEEQLQRRGYTGRTLTFGWQESQDLYAYDLMIHSQSMTFKTNLTGAHTCQIPVLGDYNVTNALIALAVGRALGVPVEAALEGLAHFQLTANRMEWLRTPEGALLLNDAYNASPTSMKAVIETLTKANISGQGRKMALLGDMRELGSMSQALHQGLSQVLDPGEIPYVFLFGTEMEHLYQVLQAKYDDDHLYWEADSHQAIAYRVEAELQAGDILLVKSSNGVNLLSVVAMLTAGGQDERNHDL